MDQVTLRAQPRAVFGTRPSKRLRREGMVPATVYGKGSDAISITVNGRELYSALHTEAGRNEISRETGIPPTTVSRTTAYKDHQARKRTTKGRKPKTRSLSNVEQVAVEGQRHEVLNQLIAEHEADFEASPLEERGDNPRAETWG